jgi:hypothetical protein
VRRAAEEGERHDRRERRVGVDPALDHGEAIATAAVARPRPPTASVLTRSTARLPRRP